MKTRKAFAVFGAGLILACCVMIYLMLDVTFFPDGKSAVKDDQWLHFEDRLSKLEQDLNRHHKISNELPEANYLKVGSVEVTKANNTLFVYNRRGKSPTSCSINFRQIPEVNVQMLDVYKQLKFDNPDGGVWKQGWSVKYNERQWNSQNKLKVFVVPHSHNDPGWLYTFEKYYNFHTKGILDNLVTKLSEDRRRKFIWAEISFFKLWWDEQTKDVKDTVKQLIRDGQLEFVAGGYVMPDESVSHWMAQLTQLTEGHDWLKKNLDYIPNTGWAIDPFGLSPTMPYLLKQSGLENLVIQRVHYSVKKKLASDKHLEFRWRQLWDNDGSTELFTHMMPFYSYDIPHSCGPDPKICCQFDFFRLPTFGLNCPWKIQPRTITKANVAERAAILLDQYRKKSQLYKTNVVLAPLGDDFRYAHTAEWDAQFHNYQKLFDYMNNQRQMNVQIQFGTLSNYFDAVRNEKSVDEFPSLSGDFFTYSDRDDHYWSGYYTSRPFHKRLDRVLLGLLRSSELLSTIAWIKGNDQLIQDNLMSRLDVARRWHSIFQHHDGVTGTSRDNVVIDYAEKMLTALNNSAHILQQSVAHLLKNPQRRVLDLNAAYFSMDEFRSHHTSPGDKHVVRIEDYPSVKRITFYNSLPRLRTKVANIYISQPYVRVTNQTGHPIKCQISPVWDGPALISTKKYELSFLVSVPALGLTTYLLHSLNNADLPEDVYLANITVYNTSNNISSISVFKKNIQIYSIVQEFSITQRPELSASFGKTGLLKAITTGDKTWPIHLEFVKYGTNHNQDKSGAYLFLPDKPEPDPIPMGTFRYVHLVQGPLFSKVIVYLPYVKHICTLFNSPGTDGLGLHIRNEIDITETENFELVMRFNSDINSKDVFYTDLNGLNMIKRQRFSKIPVQGNFYPLASAGYLQDERVRMSILSGQPLGAASMASGQFEIIQDRKLMQDDNRGLSQGVTDNLLTYHQFTLILEKRKDSCPFPTPPHEHPAGLLSLASHLVLDDLLHPLVAMHPKSNIPFELNPNFSAAGYNLGVDLSIVSLRVISIPEGAGKGVGLIVHRHALDLCWGDPSLLEKYPLSNSGEIDLSKFINDFTDWSINDAPLTFTSIGQPIRSSIISLCQHEVLGLLLQKSVV